MNNINLKDIFGKDTLKLISKKLFLFDMDGTIYEEDRVFEGAKELLNLIPKLGGKYIFITNNSSKSVNDYVEKINKLGIKGDTNNFFTSAQATVIYLKKNYPNNKIYCQGTKSLIQELKESGIIITEEVESDVDLVLVGFDTELTFDKLSKTCELLQRNIPFIATNPDINCPVHFGFVPDCGSICKMITNATKKTPIFIGKPEPIMVDFVRDKLEYSKDETCVIGDRLYTDIATGVNAGVTTICVLTGEADIADIESSSIKPEFTFNSVKDIYNILKFNNA